MDQEKIGKFIAKIRNEKQMTQQELADKIGVTDRAISKWENGRGMPDLSLIKSLCEELDITINELLSGERINEKDYQIKFEENVLKTIDYSNKKINNTKRKIIIALGIVGIIVLTIGTMFFVDVNRMNNNKPVVFSTWGFKYTPPVDLHEVQLEQAIKDYIVEAKDNEIKYYDNEKTFVSLKTYLIEEKSKELYYVYAWVLEKTFYLENDEVIQDSGSSIPHKFELRKIDNEYKVINYQIPRDGNLYIKDMKTIFPYSVRKSMDEDLFNDTFERLELDIQNQVKLYYHK